MDDGINRLYVHNVSGATVAYLIALFRSVAGKKAFALLHE